MTNRRFGRASARSVLFSILLLLVPWCVSAAEGDRVERHEDSVILVSLPPILDDDEVREQLDSGLTTTIWVKLSAQDGRGRRAEAEGWIALRYALWDEVFLAGTGGFFGVRRFQIDNLESLMDWWRQPTSATLDAADLAAADRWRVRLEVEVIPFSRLEQQDARRWMAKTLGAPEAADSEVISSPSAGDDAFGSVLRLLLATSIRPDPILATREKFLLAPIEVSP